MPERGETAAPNAADAAAERTTDAHWLAETDFVSAASGRLRRKIPGPGLPEAFVWMVGVVGAQLLIGVAVSAVILAVHVVSLGGSGDHGFVRELRQSKTLDEFVGGYSKPMLVGGQLMFVVVVLVAAWLRLRGDVRRNLALRRPSGLHGVLLVLVVLPLAMFCGQLQWWVAQVWEMLVVHLPGLGDLDALSSMKIVQAMAPVTSLPVLVLAIAVAPAIAEELVFRGIIGRGLVARWGVPIGVLLTSVFFAVVHIHPAHAAVVIPMGIFLHLVYLATRSFWAPVLLHFLNNGLAIVLTKYPHLIAVRGLADEEPLAPGLFVAATLCVLTLGWLFWQTRREYRLPDGSLWTPGYVTVEQPPAQVSAVAACRRPALWLVALAGMSLAAFAAVFMYAAVTP